MTKKKKIEESVSALTPSMNIWYILLSYCRRCASMQVGPILWQEWAPERVWDAETHGAMHMGALRLLSWARHLQSFLIGMGYVMHRLVFVKQTEVM